MNIQFQKSEIQEWNILSGLLDEKEKHSYNIREC